MTLSIDHRPLVRVARNILLRRRRPLEEGDLMDVCLQWKSSRWAAPAVGIYTRRGPLHVTVCCHEGLRGVVLRRIEKAERHIPKSYTEVWTKTLAVNGIFYDKRKYTSRVTVFFFTFCFAIEWCTKVAIEKVDVFDVGRSGVNR